jgi:hypothetical protein
MYEVAERIAHVRQFRIALLIDLTTATSQQDHAIEISHKVRSFARIDQQSNFTCGIL